MFKNIIYILIILFILINNIDSRKNFISNINIQKYTKENIYYYNKKFTNNCVNNIKKYNNFLTIKNNSLYKKNIEIIKSLFIVLFYLYY